MGCFLEGRILLLTFVVLTTQDISVRKSVLEENSPAGDVQILQAALQGYLFSLLPVGTTWAKFLVILRNLVFLSLPDFEPYCFCHFHKTC